MKTEKQLREEYQQAANKCFGDFLIMKDFHVKTVARERNNVIKRLSKWLLDDNQSEHISAVYDFINLESEG